MTRPPDLNAVECPECGRYISTNSGNFRRHADQTILRECPMSGRATMKSERAAVMVKAARSVLTLTQEIHDGDPAWVWRYLSSLERAELATLLMTALAAVPPEQDCETAFAWVYDTPAARFAS